MGPGKIDSVIRDALFITCIIHIMRVVSVPFSDERFITQQREATVPLYWVPNQIDIFQLRWMERGSGNSERSKKELMS